jgi:hypothetical protein
MIALKNSAEKISVIHLWEVYKEMPPNQCKSTNDSVGKLFDPAIFIPDRITAKALW